jgi:hypothetical protein
MNFQTPDKKLALMHLKTNLKNALFTSVYIFVFIMKLTLLSDLIYQYRTGGITMTGKASTGGGNNVEIYK